MWGETWGVLFWGGVPVPILSPGGLAMLLGSVLVLASALQTRGSRRAALGAGLFLIVLVPVMGVAVPFDFVNGTVADAEQVDANFADLEARIVALEAGAAGYDSGMVAVGSNQSILLTHDLGTTALAVSLYFSPASATSGRLYGPAPLSWREHNPERVSGVTVESITATTIRLRTGVDFRIPSVSAGPDAHDVLTSGFVRVVAVPVQ